MKHGHQNFLAKDRQWGMGSDGVKYVSFRSDPDDAATPLTVLSEYPPNHRVEPHTHDSDYVEMILEGDLTVGKEHFVKGDVRVVKGGTGYGPLTSGPDGCTMLIFFAQAQGALVRKLGRTAA